MILKKIIGFIFLASTVSYFYSCKAETKNNETSLLWEISGNGLEKSSYLFGTHHLAPITFLDSVPGLQESFMLTQQLVGELDMNNMGEMQMKLMSESLMPEGTTYDSLLDRNDIVLLDSMLINTVGVGLERFGQMKPALLNNLITLTLYQKFYPRETVEESMDEYLQKQAEKYFRPVIGLETIDDQIYALYNSQSLERQAEMLMCMVKNPDLLKDQMDELQAGYNTHDLKRIEELYSKDLPNDPCPSTQEEKDIMNKNRNLKWLERLPEIMSGKPSFIAVGCAHLPGNDGLIEGLRNLGYKVKPVLKP